jgi:uncharacterized protein YndB with AHSA1/START domain
MTNTTTDRIHKRISLRAPRSRVWRALTDAAEFGQWFGVKLDGAFQAGATIQGQITHPGCEKMTFEARVETLEPEHTFAYRWHPTTRDPGTETTPDPSTLVEFHLEETDDGTELHVTESGFDAIPEDRRAEAFRRNDGGWTEQMKNIQRFVDG